MDPFSLSAFPDCAGTASAARSLRIKLTQSNYPGSVCRQINAGETAYITGEPAMPNLTASLEDRFPIPIDSSIPGIMGSLANSLRGGSNSCSTSISSAKVHWKLRLTYPRRGSRDNYEFNADLPLGTPWNITAAFGGKFFGGNATLAWTTPGSTGGSLSFFIKGKNPSAINARNYIDRMASSSWASAIFKHESKEIERHKSVYIYNQFNPFGAHKDEPNYGYPDGWGIAQIDATGGGLPVSTEMTWNWKANIDRGLSVIAAKKKVASNHIASVNRRYAKVLQHDPLPDYRVGTRTFSAEDAFAITLYNGSGGVRLDDMLRFDPNAKQGERWSWHLPKAPHDTVPYIDRVAGEMASYP